MEVFYCYISTETVYIRVVEIFCTIIRGVTFSQKWGYHFPSPSISLSSLSPTPSLPTFHPL